MQFVTEPAETGLTDDQKASFPATASGENPLLASDDERLRLLTLDDPAAPESAVRGLINWRYEVAPANGEWELKPGRSVMFTVGSGLRLPADVQEGDIFGIFINPPSATTRISLVPPSGVGIDELPAKRFTKGISMVLRYTLVPAYTGANNVSVAEHYGLQTVQLTTSTALNNRGVFAPSTYYLTGDVVTFNNVVYIRQIEGSDTGAFDPTKWAGGGSSGETSKALFRRAGGVLNRPLVMSGFGGYNNGWSDGSELARTYSFEPNAPFTASAVQLLFGNFSLGASYAGGAVNPGQLPGLNPITVKASIYTGEGLFPLTFNNGQLSARILPGMTVLSDRLPRFIKPGAGATVMQVSVTVDNVGDKWPIGMTSRNTAPGDVIGQVNNGGVPSYHPIAVIGDPLAPRTYGSVGLVGDSIFVGGAGADLPDLGYGARALNAAGIPFVRMATYGAKLDTYTSLNAVSLALPSLVGVEHIITDMGANNMLDLLNSGLAVMQDRYLAYWKALAAGGAKVHQATVTPYDNTSPGFVALKAALNDWIRTVPAPLTSCIDAALLAETAKNSNLWKAGYTNDGLHPNEVGAAALSAAINPTIFLL
jgi:lysophospholipase L1-like esterase